MTRVEGEGWQATAGTLLPTAHTNSCLGFTEESFLNGTLQHGAHIDAQGNIIVFQTFLQRRGVDDIFMEIVGRNIVATGLTEILQNFLAFQNLTYKEKGRLRVSGWCISLPKQTEKAPIVAGIST